MSYINHSVFDVDENTTHEIEISVFDEKNAPIDLNGYDVIFTSVAANEKIEKRCTVEDNVVKVILKPCDTGALGTDTFVRKFQIRAFKDDDVYHIAEGDIKIHKVHQNYIKSPLFD